MGMVFLAISLSLDGFAAGPDVSPDQPMGRGGGVLHRWLGEDEATAPTDTDLAAAEAIFAQTGAFIMGRRTFDVGIGLWGEDGTFGRPCFVMTHREAPSLSKGPTRFTFVTEDIIAALAQAKTAAGEANICIIGGPTLARQYLAAGLVDEVQLHLVPVLLGGGTRLFELPGLTADWGIIATTASPLATHLHYRVRR